MSEFSRTSTTQAAAQHFYSTLSPQSKRYLLEVKHQLHSERISMSPHLVLDLLIASEKKNLRSVFRKSAHVW